MYKRERERERFLLNYYYYIIILKLIFKSYYREGVRKQCTTERESYNIILKNYSKNCLMY